MDLALGLPGGADLRGWLGGVGYLLLAFLPGGWFSFGFPLRGIRLWTRLCLAVVLSPLVVCAEFYPLRLVGVSFSSTAVLLVFLNLPAAFLVWRRRGDFSVRDRSAWLVGAVAVLLPVACVWSLLTHVEARIYSGHSWLHADAVNMLMLGRLALEDPTLAGLRMSYPVWTGLPFEAVHCYLTNSAAQSAYIWSDLLYLIACCGFAGAIARELGGGRLAQASSMALLLLGTNPVGYFLMQLVPLRSGHLLWGDERYTPWVSKFELFTPMTLGIALTMGILSLLVRPGALRGESIFLLGLLLCGLGLFYPLLFPPACAILFARALANLAETPGWRWRASAGEALTLAGLVALAGAATYAEVKFLTAERQATQATVLLSQWPSAMRKLFAAFVSTSVLLAGVAFSIRGLWQRHRRASILLLAGAGASYLLYAAFFIPYYENEYKFVFAVAMCLAAFAGIAVERIWRQGPRWAAIPALALAGLLVFGAYGSWACRNWPAPWLGPHGTSRSYSQTYSPPLDSGGLYLQLNRQDGRFGICNAVRNGTPDRSVLLVDDSAIYYPGLTERSLYVAAQNRSYPGVNQWDDALETEVRGYSPKLLAERRQTQSMFFETASSTQRESALRAVQALHRPVAVIADSRHADLLHWLRTESGAREIYADSGASLWLIEEPGGG